MVLSSTGDVLCSVLSLSFITNVTSITAYCERIFSGHLRWTDSSCQFSGFFYINLRLRLKVRWTFLYIRQDTLIQCSGYRIAVKKTTISHFRYLFYGKNFITKSLRIQTALIARAPVPKKRVRKLQQDKFRDKTTLLTASRADQFCPHQSSFSALEAVGWP